MNLTSLHIFPVVSHWRGLSYLGMSLASGVLKVELTAACCSLAAATLDDDRGRAFLGNSPSTASVDVVTPSSESPLDTDKLKRRERGLERCSATKGCKDRRIFDGQQLQLDHNIESKSPSPPALMPLLPVLLGRFVVSPATVGRLAAVERVAVAVALLVVAVHIVQGLVAVQRRTRGRKPISINSRCFC